MSGRESIRIDLEKKNEISSAKDGLPPDRSLAGRVLIFPSSLSYHHCYWLYTGLDGKSLFLMALYILVGGREESVWD